MFRAFLCAFLLLIPTILAMHVINSNDLKDVVSVAVQDVDKGSDLLAQNAFNVNILRLDEDAEYADEVMEKLVVITPVLAPPKPCSVDGSSPFSRNVVNQILQDYRAQGGSTFPFKPFDIYGWHPKQQPHEDALHVEKDLDLSQISALNESIPTIPTQNKSMPLDDSFQSKFLEILVQETQDSPPSSNDLKHAREHHNSALDMTMESNIINDDQLTNESQPFTKSIIEETGNIDFGKYTFLLQTTHQNQNNIIDNKKLTNQSQYLSKSINHRIGNNDDQDEQSNKSQHRNIPFDDRYHSTFKELSAQNPQANINTALRRSSTEHHTSSLNQKYNAPQDVFQNFTHTITDWTPTIANIGFAEDISFKAATHKNQNNIIEEGTLRNTPPIVVTPRIDSLTNQSEYLKKSIAYDTTRTVDVMNESQHLTTIDETPEIENMYATSNIYKSANNQPKYLTKSIADDKPRANDLMNQSQHITTIDETPEIENIYATSNIYKSANYQSTYVTKSIADNTPTTDNLMNQSQHLTIDETPEIENIYATSNIYKSANNQPKYLTKSIADDTPRTNDLMNQSQHLTTIDETPEIENIFATSNIYKSANNQPKYLTKSIADDTPRADDLMNQSQDLTTIGKTPEIENIYATSNIYKSANYKSKYLAKSIADDTPRANDLMNQYQHFKTTDETTKIENIHSTSNICKAANYQSKYLRKSIAEDTPRADDLTNQSQHSTTIDETPEIENIFATSSIYKSANNPFKITKLNPPQNTYGLRESSCEDEVILHNKKRPKIDILQNISLNQNADSKIIMTLNESENVTHERNKNQFRIAKNVCEFSSENRIKPEISCKSKFGNESRIGPQSATFDNIINKNVELHKNEVYNVISSQSNKKFDRNPEAQNISYDLPQLSTNHTSNFALDVTNNIITSSRSNKKFDRNVVSINEQVEKNETNLSQNLHLQKCVNNDQISLQELGNNEYAKSKFVGQRVSTYDKMQEIEARNINYDLSQLSTNNTSNLTLDVTNNTIITQPPSCADWCFSQELLQDLGLEINSTDNHIKSSNLEEKSTNNTTIIRPPSCAEDWCFSQELLQDLGVEGNGTENHIKSSNLKEKSTNNTTIARPPSNAEDWCFSQELLQDLGLEVNGTDNHIKSSNLEEKSKYNQNKPIESYNFKNFDKRTDTDQFCKNNLSTIDALNSNTQACKSGNSVEVTADAQKIITHFTKENCNNSTFSHSLGEFKTPMEIAKVQPVNDGRISSYVADWCISQKKFQDVLGRNRSFSTIPVKSDDNPAKIYSSNCVQADGANPAKIHSSNYVQADAVNHAKIHLSNYVQDDAVNHPKIYSSNYVQADEVDTENMYSSNYEQPDSVTPAKIRSSNYVQVDNGNPPKIYSSNNVQADTVHPARIYSSNYVQTDEMNTAKIYSSNYVQPNSINPAKIYSSNYVQADSINPAKIYSSNNVQADTVNPVKIYSSNYVQSDAVNRAKIHSSNYVKDDAVNHPKMYSSNYVQADEVDTAKIYASNYEQPDSVNPAKIYSSNYVQPDSVNSAKMYSSNYVQADAVNPAKIYSSNNLQAAHKSFNPTYCNAKNLAKSRNDSHFKLEISRVPCKPRKTKQKFITDMLEKVPKKNEMLKIQDISECKIINAGQEVFSRNNETNKTTNSNEDYCANISCTKNFDLDVKHDLDIDLASKGIHKMFKDTKYEPEMFKDGFSRNNKNAETADNRAFICDIMNLKSDLELQAKYGKRNTDVPSNDINGKTITVDSDDVYEDVNWDLEAKHTKTGQVNSETNHIREVLTQLAGTEKTVVDMNGEVYGTANCGRNFDSKLLCGVDVLQDDDIKDANNNPAMIDHAKKLPGSSTITKYFPKSNKIRRIHCVKDEVKRILKQSKISISSGNVISFTGHVKDKPRRVGSSQKRRFCTPYKSQVSQMCTQNKENIEVQSPQVQQVQEMEVNYVVVYINEETCDDLLQKLEQSFPVEILLDLIYKDGSSQLSMLSPEKMSGIPAGILMALKWTFDSENFYYIETASIDISDNSWHIMNLFRCLLGPGPSCRRVCCGARALFLHILCRLALPGARGWEVWDPLIGCWLLNPEGLPASLGDLQASLGICTGIRASNARTMNNACWQLADLSKVVEKMEHMLQQEGLMLAFVEIETKMIPILAAMEYRGIKIDESLLSKMSDILKDKLNDCENRAHESVGKAVNLNSHLAVRRILYDDLHLDASLAKGVAKTTILSEKSISQSTLLRLAGLHPLPGIVLEHRRLRKAAGGCIESIRKCIRGGSIFPYWEQMGVATGRPVPRSPDLRAVHGGGPHGEGPHGRGLRFRAPFVARAGHVLVAIDFRNVEMQLLAHYAQDAGLLEVLALPGDVFNNITDAVAVPGNVGLQDQRRKTGAMERVVNEMIHGAGPGRVAEALAVDLDEAKSIIERFHGKFPRVREFRADLIRRCKKAGVVRTFSGRRSSLSNINNSEYGVRSHCERQALGFFLQASAADVCKHAAVFVDGALSLVDGLECHPLLQIRDELVWEVRSEHLAKATELIYKSLSSTNNFCKYLELRSAQFPFRILAGNNWDDMKTKL